MGSANPHPGFLVARFLVNWFYVRFKMAISKNKPKLTILTHFGMGMVKSKPWEIAESLSKRFGVKVIAASDGMEINPNDY